MIAQILLGSGGSPLFTLGTIYVDDHVKNESSSMYIGEIVFSSINFIFLLTNYFIGVMYSMAAFGPVLGFLLGAYLLSFHMDAFSGDFVGNNGELNFLLINFSN